MGKKVCGSLQWGHVLLLRELVPETREALMENCFPTQDLLRRWDQLDLGMNKGGRSGVGERSGLWCQSLLCDVLENLRLWTCWLRGTSEVSERKAGNTSKAAGFGCWIQEGQPGLERKHESPTYRLNWVIAKIAVPEKRGLVQSA
jgi:hypothetical protein